jgi:hypothetical protein
VAGFNCREFARWCALPCLFFWFGIMVLIWLFLLGWSHIVSGHFSPVEIAMTIVAGVASTIGFALSMRRARWSFSGCALIVLFGVPQFLAFRISLLPAIAHQ